MNKIYLIIIFSVLFLLTGCRDDDPDNPKEEEKHTERTVLIYAVASNNLSSYLVWDQNEMIEAAPSVEGLGGKVRVLIYSVASSNDVEATLTELKRNDAGEWKFEPLRTYDRNTFSTDPARMRDVFADVRNLSPSDRYGLIFWSHGTGWIPNFSSHQKSRSDGRKRSFGIDINGNTTDYCDIAELAEAVPSGMFDYIWFDCCYMMGIEVAYQLRDKCDYIAGYPTEDWSPGMNYDSTLPLLAAAKPDLAGAADAFYHYYADADQAVTVTVARTDGLEALASASASVYAAGDRPISTEGLQNYSRLSEGLYDFGQFTRAYLSGRGENDAALLSAFDSALKDVMVYGKCSDKDFNFPPRAFDPDIYSGFSCHFPGRSFGSREEYYETLDWVIATRP